MELQRWWDAVRRNHGLEHATVAVLIDRHGPSRMAGRASRDGFFILGEVDPSELESCAREALQRMQSGQGDLAVSPLCGTNLVVHGALSACAAAAVLSRGSTSSQLPNAILAVIGATLIAPVVGRWVQRSLTTRSDLRDVEIVGVRAIVGPLKKVQTRGAG